jgi:uncharacterized protein (DUF1778 family)
MLQWGGSKNEVDEEPTKRQKADLAAFYNETGDVSAFGEAEPVEVRRAVTISVRFSEEEISDLRRRADTAGVKVTAFIRQAALEAARPVDRAVVERLAAEVEHQAHELRVAIGK